MDSAKLRNSSKISNTKPPTTTKPKQNEIKLSEDEGKTVTDLKKLYLETIKLDVDLQREIYNLEKAFETKHDEIFQKRFKLLEEIRRKSHGDVAKQANIANFWLRVLKASYTEFISKRDEKILASLIDIRSKLYNEPIVKFVIDFQFAPNEFFSNNTLTKTYFLNCLPDADDPLTYDGAEIFKCEGCKINWKNNEKDKDKKAGPSFFDFFNPPTLPEDVDDPNYYDINTVLQNDFELGFYLKERVIPKAIMFFTGEIADCQSSESETEDTDNDDDEDEDDDDDDDDDDSSGNDAVRN